MRLIFEDIEKSEVRAYAGLTYDLEVEEDHSYNIDGVVVHNSACTTAPGTGFGTRDWQLAAVQWCAEATESMLIVADGGIRENGDIAKALAFGAHMVMVGGALAGHDENPGDLFESPDGSLHKVFFGSASEHQKGEVKHVEGKKLLIPYRGPIQATLQHMEENLQSAVSYGGGRAVEDLRSVGYVLLRR